MKPKELQVLRLNAERLSAAGPERPACEACGLWKTCRTPYLRPRVPKGWTRRILLIGEAPGRHEDKISRQPFTGEAGRLLRECWQEAGFEAQDVALVNAVRCRPRGNVPPTMSQVRACRPFLLRVIEVLRPERILALGSTALRALLNDGHATNVTSARSRILQVAGEDARVRFLVTYHPAAVLHGAVAYRERIVRDLRDADRLTRDYDLAWPREEYPRDDTIGLDTEFVETAGERRVLAVGVADSERAVSCPVPLGDRRVLGILRRAKVLCTHNGAVDVDSLIQLGLCKEAWAQGRDLRDSLWLARLADENRGRGGYKLENLFLEQFHTNAWKDRTEQYGPDPRAWPPALLYERCRLDAWAARLLTEYYRPLARGACELQHRIGLTLQRVYHTGVFIDLHKLASMRREGEARLVETGRRLIAIAEQHGMSEFKPGNANHVRTLLYKHLRWPVLEKTPTGRPSISNVVLQTRAGACPEAQLLLDYSQQSKIMGTYLMALEKQVSLYRRPGDGERRAWLPVRINPLGARTLRRSSGSDPLEGDEARGLNWQNWGKSLRPLVVSRFAGGLIVDHDYHKLEAILQGWLAGEERMVDYFLKRPNGYIEIGQRLFGKSVEEGTPDYRTVKALVLGTNYNMSPAKLAQELWQRAGVRLADTFEAHTRRAEELHARYLRMFPRLKVYIQRCIEDVHRHHRIVMSLGYLRRLPIPPEPPRSDREAWTRWRKHVSHVENEAVNCRAQHLASLITGSAMLDVEARLLRRYNLSFVSYHKALMEHVWPRMPLLVNEVHDDLVYDVPPECQKDLALIKETMQELPTLRRLMPELPDIIRVGQCIGPAWGVTGEG